MTGDGGVVTYDEIVRKRVDAIATQLLNAGVTTGSRVAVLQEPCPDWVSSILAIMRIGATFVPLDVGLPSARLSAIVKDCQPQAVLANVNTRRRAYELGPEASNIVIVSDNPGSKVTNSATSGGVPAILYTSGSSRTPKGIALTHRGISSWFEPCAMLYGLKSKGEVVLQQSSQGFDMALMQIFTALCFGGSVYLLPQKFRGDARAISDIIARFGVTHTYGTPSEYCSWLRFGSSEMLRNSSWKNALVGGEALAPSVLKAFATLGKDDLRFHHMYGTTESTFCAAVMELDYTDDALEKTFTTSQLSYPAGVALPNYNIYILDEQQNPLTVGLQGEIYIGGAGVAQGYINNSSLTERTFVADPFATADDRAKGWGMMQRTGDLGRWSRVDHGALIVEGRISDDTMVKIRGLRVDLREVEVAFLHAGAGMISEVIVSTRRGSPESPEFLVAHVLLHEGILRERLQELRARLELPLYMQPSFIIALDSFPTTASGKRDRKAISTLPLPVDNVNNDDIAWTSTEENLKEVWENVLPADLTKSYNITPETDFFHIGGTSLLLLPLRDNIKTKFGIELQLLDLFEASVLSSLARRIQGRIDKTKDIDWDKETSLRHSMIKVESNMIQVPQSQSKVVILTGGSGYLGKALIHAMIQDPTVKEIHCLGVRRVTSRMDMKNLPKVTLYEGDLCQPRIGLSHSVIDQLFSRADIVIHNGSDISYMKTYQSIRQSNFLVTKDLIEWCMPRMVPFHFISTAGIGNFTPGMALKETSVSSYSPPTDGSMAYTACKWASEVFLEKLVEKHPQWPVHVHRPTLISREDIPELDGMHNILGYARMMGAVPASQGVARGLVNVVQLETVVAGIMKPVLSQGQCSGGVHYSNHMGRLNLPLNNMRKWALERSAGGEVDFSTVHLEEIPMEEWIRKAIELGMHPTMGAVMSSFARRGEVDFPVVTKGDGGM
jgi:hybrid polyketide synthase/nonribosomal peptide synthetase ACE1